jgi:hypothetical protein
MYRKRIGTQDRGRSCLPEDPDETLFPLPAVHAAAVKSPDTHSFFLHLFLSPAADHHSIMPGSGKGHRQMMKEPVIFGDMTGCEEGNGHKRYLFQRTKIGRKHYSCGLRQESFH